jgi:hypothetical protein
MSGVIGSWAEMQDARNAATASWKFGMNSSLGLLGAACIQSSGITSVSSSHKSHNIVAPVGIHDDFKKFFKARS